MNATLLLVAVVGFAQERIALDGPWEIAPAAVAADAAKGDGAPTSARPSAYDKTIEVPSAFETTLGTKFDGVAWYRRALPVDAKERDARVRIEFAAVATAARVLVNGVEVGRHLGGWTPFAVEATSALKFDGSDVVEVEVDEKVGHNTQGFLPIVQPHFGGIWQGVTLCVDRGPVIDRDAFWSFGKFDPASGGGVVDVRVPWHQGSGRGLDEGPVLEFELLDGQRSLVKRTWGGSVGATGDDVASIVNDERERSGAGLVVPGHVAKFRLQLGKVEPWSPASPRLYRLCARLLDGGGKTLDSIERNVGFRSMSVDGTTILWNGAPLQVRGLLHWGHSPPYLAPPTERDYWKQQLVELKGLGFNTLKCCLWVPPSCVYELCDEMGLLVWQEYPTWHPTMDEAHRVELRREYEEFFVHDGSHASVAFRSITCETGHDAQLAVVKELFEACHAAVPDTLVVDDSSWIGWQRITDFWDEHPYGNHRWWPKRLADFAQHQIEKGKKPLLLGECMAGDTWFDRAAWEEKWGSATASGDSMDAVSGAAAPWWRPHCYEAQIKFEEWLTQECGAETVASLLPTSIATALEARKYQIETLRATLPDAGYVVSVASDFGMARMGLRDDLGQMKWEPEEWSWHGDVMLSLRTEGERRAFIGSMQVPIVATSFDATSRQRSGRSCRFDVSMVAAVEDDSLVHRCAPIDFVLGEAPVRLERAFEAEATTIPRPWDVEAALVDQLDVREPPPTPEGAGLFIRGSTPPYLALNKWKLWQLPTFSDALPASVREVDHLDAATLDFLEQGGRVLLKVAGAKHSFKSDGMWWLKGAPFTPPHPVHATVPADMLRELQPFDLDGERVMAWTALRGQVDPILAFWESHDIPEVRAHLFAFDTRVGKGRLLASCLDATSDAGRYVRAAFARHLADGPAPKRELSAATIAALRGLFDEQRLDLPEWRFTMDPKDEGLAAGFAKPEFDASAWRAMPAGSHWENHGDDVKHYTGIAWYRVDVELDAKWGGVPARAVFEGIDDSAIVWLDGREVGRFGDPATQTTIWLETQQAELGPLTPGRHTLTLRVVDHAGAGGLWRPAYLTTGPIGDVRTLLE